MRYILIIITVLFSISSTAFARHYNACDNGQTYIDSKCIDNKLLPEIKTVKINEINLLNGKIESIIDKLDNIATSVENGSFNQSNKNIKLISKEVIQYVDIKLDARKFMYAYIGDVDSDDGNSSSCMSGRREQCRNKGQGMGMSNGQGRGHGKGMGQGMGHGRGRYTYDNSTNTQEANNTKVVADTNTVNYNAKKRDAMNNDLADTNARNHNMKNENNKNGNRNNQHGGCFHRGYTRVRDGIGLSVYKATFDLYNILNKSSVSNLHKRDISNKHSSQLQALNDNLVSAFTNYDLYYSNISGGKVDQKDIDKYRAEYLVAIEKSITFLANTYKTEISKLSNNDLKKVKSVRTSMFKKMIDRSNNRNKRTIQLIEQATAE